MKRSLYPAWRLVLVLPLLAWACSDDAGDGGVDPGSGGTEDRVTFLVYTLHPGEPDLLRWRGNADGPAPDSPELTSHPYVGYGRPFRVEWKITFATGPTVGYRYRASQRDGTPFLPVDTNGDPAWGQRASFIFHNDTAAGALEGEDCDSGPDCPDRLRFDSGLHEIRVMALDATGEQTEATLEFDVNYPPETVIPLDEGPVCGDDPGFPRYTYTPLDGEPIVCTFAPGDTIPAGSVVTVEMDGFDRLESHVMTDSFCCDTRLDDQAPEVRLQGLVDFVGLDHDLQGVPLGFGPGFGPLSEARRVQFRVGPFDCTFHARAADEHDRRDYTTATLSFVAGFSPWITDVDPGEGDRIVLNPDWSEAWFEAGITNVRYYASVDTTWYWTKRDWSVLPDPEYQPYRGTVFRIPLRFFGAHDPREPTPAGADERRYAGGIHSWAYRFLSENDPENSVAQGSGLDDLYVDLFADAPETDRWIDVVVVFVPRDFWDYPEYFDPAGPCPIEEWCDIGWLLWRELGDTTLDVRGKTTPGLAEAYCRYAPAEVEGGGECTSIIDLAQYGRYTQRVTTSFSMRLGLADETGNLVQEWPPGDAALRPVRGRFLR